MRETDNEAGRRPGVKRNAVILVVIAVAVYAAFIVSGVMRSQGG